MDKAKAQDLAAKVVGTTLAGWSIGEHLDCGKSAAVFHATCGSDHAAVKIFDEELLERYGAESQIKRIERELQLKDVHHENLVKILDGGVDSNTGNHFIVMEYIIGPTLAQAVKDIPYDNIPSLIEQLSSAAKFLEDLGFCHRDIKPANIKVLDNYQKVILLDLGVIRPVGDGSVTDEDGIQAFVGTLQYSPPEFLMRTEEDSVDGWRAVTFYQLGGVLHDLIMRNPLFEEFKYPYARLVTAVKEVHPPIMNQAVPARVRSLAQKCLLKDWRKRLELLRWESFSRKVLAAEPEAARDRVTERLRDASLSRPNKVREPTENQAGLPKRALEEEVLEFVAQSVSAIRASVEAVPRGTARRWAGKAAEPKGILFTLDADEGKLLYHGICCLLTITIEDDSVGLVSIRGQAVTEPAPVDCELKHGDVVYQGVFEGDAVYSALTDYVFRVIDAVQNRTGFSGEPVILDLGGERNG